jgi:glutamyl-tRNA synthetase
MAASNIRVRFAPSPTGSLHVGGVRTALFNWLYARKVGGRFLLRVEDTDRHRSSDEHTAVILDGLRWIGLDWDEDVMFQGAGLQRHQRLAQTLLESEHTYLDEGAIRFRMPKDVIAWDDIVHGRIAFNGADIPDWIILRSDRTPTYNFSVVADDLEMRISHVLRGDDHISNTPKQLAVYRALDRDPPLFGHVPNVHGTDGKKLSKRHGATAIGDYRAQGFLPAAMRNFLALLGWSPGTDRELFFATEELIAAFSLEGIQVKAAVFDPAKLEWMNGQYISHMTSQELLPDVRAELVGKLGLDVTAIGDDRILRAIDTAKTRARLTKDLAEKVAVRLDASFIGLEDKAKNLIAKDPSGFLTALGESAGRLETIDGENWQPEPLEAQLRQLAEELGLGVGKIMQPIRIALTGATVSEPVNELLYVVGKDQSLARLGAAKRWVDEDVR